MTATRGRRALALLACVSLALAACGGDDDAEPSDDTETTADGGDDGGDADEPADDGDEPADDGGDGDEPADDADEAADDGGDGDEPADDADAVRLGVTTTGVSYDADPPCDATVPGSQIDYGIFVPNSGFDPIFTSGALVGGTENAAVWDVLMVYDANTGETRPHLAESLEPDDDSYMTWTLTLREGITYSDGTPLTAQLVSDNMDRFFPSEGVVRNTSGGFLQFIESKEVVDDLTLSMTMTTPIAELGLFFADEPGMIVNLNAIGDDLDAFRLQPPDAAGLGPYVVERNVPGEETVLKARQDYWGGPVCVETLRFVWVPGTAPTYDAFKSGDLDVAFVRDPIVNQQAIDDGVQHFYFNQDGGAMFNFNHREGHVTADPRLREAISLAIDPEIINDRSFQGSLVTTKSYFGPNSRHLTDAVEPQPLDLERAAALVEEMKGEGWDGTLSFVAGNDSAQAENTALAVEGMLTSIGITPNTELMPTSETIGRLGAGEFDLIGNGFNSGPDTGLLSLVRNLSSTSNTNRMGYESDEMDALLAEALGTPFADLPPVMAEINNQINADWAATTYGATSEGVIWTDSVSGIVPTMSTIFLFHNAGISE